MKTPAARRAFLFGVPHFKMRRSLPYILVFLAALVVKAAVLASIHAHPLLQPSGDMDGAVYLDLARSGPPAVAYFVSPLYVYFLKLAGASIAVASIAQIVLGSIGVVLLFDTARRWFGMRGAFRLQRDREGPEHQCHEEGIERGLEDRHFVERDHSGEQ
jgi:hypothetical protein